MTARRLCPPVPGPLEAYVAVFDDLFGHVAQRRGIRAYLQGLLLPHNRHKTLTALAGAEPIVQAQTAEVQRLQFFLSESGWDAEALNNTAAGGAAGRPDDNLARPGCPGDRRHR